MLKAHQACIDLEKNVLRIQGREVRFLSEHELPDKARDPLEPQDAEMPPNSAPAGHPSSSPTPRSFPGSGNTLGTSQGSRSQATSQPASTPSSWHSEEHIRLLMDLGATRAVAISSLDAAGGNVDVAASLLF